MLMLFDEGFIANVLRVVFVRASGTSSARLLLQLLGNLCLRRTMMSSIELNIKSLFVRLCLTRTVRGSPSYVVGSRQDLVTQPPTVSSDSYVVGSRQDLESNYREFETVGHALDPGKT